MLNKNPKERPSALAVLNSDWIKNKIKFDKEHEVGA